MNYTVNDVMGIIRGRGYYYYRYYNIEKFMEYEDFISTCYLKFYSKEKDYNPKFALSTFIDFLVRGCATKLVRDNLYTNKRLKPSQYVYDKPITDNEGHEASMFDRMSVKENYYEEVEINDLIERALEMLNDKDRLYAKLLIDGYNQPELIDKLNLKSNVPLSRAKRKFKDNYMKLKEECYE